MNDNETVIPEPTADEQKSKQELILPDKNLPTQLYLLPTSNRPFFPGQALPVITDQQPWASTIKSLVKTPHRTLGLSYITSDIDSKDVSPGDFAEIGCAVKVHHIEQEGQHYQILAQGIQRFKIVRWLKKDQPYLVEVNYIDNNERQTDEQKAYAIAIINIIKELLTLNPLYNEELKNYLRHFSPNEPSLLTDFAATLTTASGDELQQVLETIPLLKRMEKVLPLLRNELEIARIQQTISDEVDKNVDQHQREFFLHEQLKVIQKELGISKDDRTTDVEEFVQRLKDKQVPEHAQKKIDDELKKLAVLETGSPEYAVTRNYLDWVTAMPWGVYSDDKLDLSKARKVLNSAHDGLDDVKERIIEFLAVGSYKGEISGSILLLVGPPGVGKTSIGHSIADALGRKFYRFSVGGMRDEAEIKGHRRTYIGSMPGKFVQALREVDVSNPVIMLDEIDKIGNSYQGDPASALLEALDPEQNNQFLDHYLDLRVDLSKVLFVCTANMLANIPAPLRDRMDSIHLSGYITEEKLAIAKHHLWPKQRKKAGLTYQKIQISDAALKQIIEGYAREAGVRNLEKQLSKIIRKSVVKLIEQPESKIRVGVKNLHDFLGQPLFQNKQTLQGVGIVTGLAWTSVGGTTLPIEANAIHRSQRGFKLTGKLGKVMSESAEIALSYVNANITHFGGDAEFFEKTFIHLHVPEGATPKDGPSAGITMATALISLVLNKPIKKKVSMTGEITLTGKVLPVGGIREKIIAAKRVRFNEIILPEACRRDYDELPDFIKAGLNIHFVETYNDVFAIVFE